MIIAWKDDMVDPALITPWSLIHLVVGAASKSYVDFYTGQTLHIVYELIGSKNVGKFFKMNVRRSSDLNSVGDHLSFSLGQTAPKRPWTMVALLLFCLFTWNKVGDQNRPV